VCRQFFPFSHHLQIVYIRSVIQRTHHHFGILLNQARTTTLTMSSRIILKSDDSLKYYPNNKPNRFTVKTKNLTHIGQDLEVALCEIKFPFGGFKNVRDGYNEITVILAKDYDDADNAYDELTNDEILDMPTVSFIVKPNFYTPLQLIDELNKEMSSRELSKMELNVMNDNRGCLTVDKKIRIKFGYDVAKILGYNWLSWLTFGPQKRISPNKAGAYRKMAMLKVYCSAVEERLVHGNHHQLLRLVYWPCAEVMHELNATCFIYNNPYFMRVKTADVENIEIIITDSYDIPIEFLGDEPVVAILEFRKTQ